MASHEEEKMLDDQEQNPADVALSLHVEEEVNRRVMQTLERMFSAPVGTLTQHAECPEMAQHILLDMIASNLRHNYEFRNAVLEVLKTSVAQIPSNY